MTSMLWQKDGIEIDSAVMNFLAGDDIVLDRELLEYDIQASKAHAKGLASIDILTRDESQALCTSLDELLLAWREGRFSLDDRFEDGHSAIEYYLTQELGSLGGKIHLGRSRNDQVLVATRLYMRASLDNISTLLCRCAQASLDQARAHQHDPMPGYTHLQRAVPSTLGLWFASFAESFADSAHLAAFTSEWINANPLGTAAGYGVNVTLPRQQTTKHLGFDRLAINPMAAQASRGKHEHQVIATLWQAMQDVRRLAWDLSLFCTQEFAFAAMPNRATTGSSIMPNKRNPDLAELLRASSAIVAGAMAEIQQVLSLPSGYHRDLQLTKAPLVRAIKTTTQALALVPMLITDTRFNLQRLRDSIDPTMLATDRAVEHALAGMPFREAYQRIANDLTNDAPIDIDASIHARTSPGACADLMLDELAARIDAAQIQDQHSA